MSLGIGIITYNRCSNLMTTVEAIKAHTSSPFRLIVADDGSTDETLSYLQTERILYITGQNRGIAWNKNRALFYLNTIERCDTIIIFEDDTFPVSPGWEKEWIEAARRWGHINHAVPWRSSYWLSGIGTAEDPIRSKYLSGQVSAFSAEALGIAGYLDTRFKAYGYEHVEHTNRLIACGFGGAVEPKCYLLLKGGIKVTSPPSFGTAERVEENANILKNIEAENMNYGSPWRNDSERVALVDEIKRTMTLYKKNDS